MVGSQAQTPASLRAKRAEEKQLQRKLNNAKSKQDSGSAKLINHIIQIPGRGGGAGGCAGGGAGGGGVGAEEGCAGS